ncbi:hypothetical protein [Nocardia stercoris]|nr:hypothetical protein [Nocardia stercoris]
MSLLELAGMPLDQLAELKDGPLAGTADARRRTRQAAVPSRHNGM